VRGGSSTISPTFGEGKAACRTLAVEVAGREAAMKTRLEELVAAARDTTKRRRARRAEAGLRADAEAIGKRDGAGRLRAALGGEPRTSASIAELGATGVPGAGRGAGAQQEAAGVTGTEGAARVAVIAEVKGASPLRGPLREPFEPLAIAREYEDNGAAAVSVLTEEHFFAGSIDHLEAVSAAIALPTLRKDFVTEPYQIFAAAVAGAGGVLLIAEVLDGAALAELVEAARSVGLDSLVEFHRPSLLAAAVGAGSGIIGINNRNLDTMEIDFEHALALAPELPAGVIAVAESAVSEPDDIVRVGRAGYRAVLVGTALMTAESPGAKLRELVDAGKAVGAAPPDGEGPRPTGRAAGSGKQESAGGIDGSKGQRPARRLGAKGRRPAPQALGSEKGSGR
jgi:indole-3-glycerol phosphate synthase